MVFLCSFLSFDVPEFVCPMLMCSIKETFSAYNDYFDILSLRILFVLSTFVIY